MLDIKKSYKIVPIKCHTENKYYNILRKKWTLDLSLINWSWTGLWRISNIWMNGNEWTGNGEGREYVVFGNTRSVIQTKSENACLGIVRNRIRK